MSLADENKQLADEMLLDAETDSAGMIDVQFNGLYTRRITSKDQKALQMVMDYLTGSFSFECVPIYIDNGFGYEITLPRIMID